MNQCFLFHKWLRWSEPDDVNVVRTHQELAGVQVALEKPLTYTEERQRRSCLRCGKIQERVI